MDQIELQIEIHYIGVPSGVSNTISKPMLRLAQIVHLFCTDTNTVSKRTKTHDPRNLGDPSGASKMIFEPMVCSTQSMHVPCVKIGTISKRTESSFHLSLVTKDYHWVRRKSFLSLRYVWRKLCTYLAPILMQSPNQPKWDSKWPTSPMSSIGCVQNNFWACGIFSANMHQTCVKISTISKRTKMSIYLSLIT
jgi:hypothetical protein